jgi:hypothetical protein
LAFYFINFTGTLFYFTGTLCHIPATLYYFSVTLSSLYYLMAIIA